MLAPTRCFLEEQNKMKIIFWPKKPKTQFFVPVFFLLPRNEIGAKTKLGQKLKCNFYFLKVLFSCPKINILVSPSGTGLLKIQHKLFISFHWLSISCFLGSNFYKHQPSPVWPEENRQMSIKVAHKLFH